MKIVDLTPEYYDALSNAVIKSDYYYGSTTSLDLCVEVELNKYVLCCEYMFDEYYPTDHYIVTSTYVYSEDGKLLGHLNNEYLEKLLNKD